MADEKKTYLVNIESNLKKYSEDAAKAKEEVDKLTASNNELKKSGTATTAEIEANNAALRNAQKEYSQAKKMVDLQTAANKGEVGSRKQLGEILQLQMQALGKLGGAYITNAKGIKELNPLYIEQRRRIAETKQAILDYDKALNDGRSNVGRYGEAIEGAFKDAGSKIMSMVGPMALVGAAIGLATKLWEGMKEAIMSTSFAIDLMNKSAAVSKQLFYDLAINGQTNIATLISASKVQGELNVLRIEEGFETLKISKINREEQAVREQSIDRTRTHTQRLEDLNRVTELESEKTKIKVDHLQKELKAKQDLLKLQPANEKLMFEVLAIQTKINDTYAEEDQAMRRVNTQRTGFMQEEIDARKKGYDAWMAEIDTSNKAIADKILSDQKTLFALSEKLLSEYDRAVIESLSGEDKLAAQRDFGLKQIAEMRTQMSKLGLITVEQEVMFLKLGEEVWRKFIEGMRKEAGTITPIKVDELLKNSLPKLEGIKPIAEGIGISKDDEDEQAARREALIQAGIQAAQTSSDAIFQIKSNRLNAEMEAELSNTKLTEAQRNVIRKKYAKEQQKMAIIQAVINGALGVVSSLTGPPIYKWIEAAAVAVATLAQIAVIKSQSLDGGGGGSAPTAISGSVPAQRTFAQAQGSSILTQTQLTQPQLNAIPSQNLLTAADIALAISKLPAPIVTVEDINVKVASKRKIEVRANI